MWIIQIIIWFYNLISSVFILFLSLHILMFYDILFPEMDTIWSICKINNTWVQHQQQRRILLKQILKRHDQPVSGFLPKAEIYLNLYSHNATEWYISTGLKEMHLTTPLTPTSPHPAFNKDWKFEIVSCSPEKSALEDFLSSLLEKETQTPPRDQAEVWSTWKKKCWAMHSFSECLLTPICICSTFCHQSRTS